jgi:hypothetical protein
MERRGADRSAFTAHLKCVQASDHSFGGHSPTVYKGKECLPNTVPLQTSLAYSCCAFKIKNAYNLLTTVLGGIH